MLIKLLVLFIIISLTSCDNEENIPTAEVASVSQTLAVSSIQMLTDDVSNDELQSDRFAFKTTEMLSIQPLNDTQFVVKNFVPMDLENVTVTVQFGDLSTVLKLLTIDTVKAHSETVYNYPTVSGVNSYESTDGDVVVIDPTVGLPASVITLDFLPTSEKLQMLKAITIEWSCVFNDFFSDSDSATQANTMWRPIRPAQARLYTLLMMNTAYLFSQQEYEERFLNEPLYKYVDNDTRIVEDDQWMTMSEKEDIWNNKISKKSFRLGITAGGGLGGGSALGISNGTLTKQFKHKWNDSLPDLDYLPSEYYTGPHPLYSHEMGHCFGYGHNSNMCSTGRRDVSGTDGWKQMFGFPAVSVLMHAKYVHYELFPCMQDEYYNQIDFEYVQPDRYEPY